MSIETRTVKEILDDYDGNYTYGPATFGYEDTGFVDIVDLYREDSGEAYILTANCSEYLEFHRGQYPELFEPFESDEDEPELTQEAYDVAVELFWDRYEAEVYEETDGYLRFNVSVTTDDATRTPADLDNELDPKIGKLINELDPGTFMADYAFSLIAAEVKRRAEATE